MTTAVTPAIRAPAEVVETTLSDNDIVQRVLRGEIAAFELLMRRHNQRVFRAARAVLRDDSEAQDAAQQAWLSIFSHLSQWDGRAAFSTWALRIVVNEAAGRLRTQKRAPALREVLANEGRSQPTPEQQLQRAQVRAHLERAIDGLPDPLRMVLVLRDLEDLSGQETADALGLNEDLIRVRLHRARRMLRTSLEQTFDAALDDAFAFLGARCDAIVQGVLAALGTPERPPQA